MKKEVRISISKNGPYIVIGNPPIYRRVIGIGEDNEPKKWVKEKTVTHGEACLLCRCGSSKTKPFCDFSHGEAEFNGEETASKETHKMQSEVFDGPTLKLLDAPVLCALARFCDRGEGTWELVMHSDNPKSRKLAIEEACLCPSGRLVVINKKNGKVLEKKYSQSIILIEDPQKKVSGSIFLEGGIPVVSSDGSMYEVRNRQTLCRCGKSYNKPFCDGTHIQECFNDGDESLQ